MILMMIMMFMTRGRMIILNLMIFANTVFENPIEIQLLLIVFTKTTQKVGSLFDKDQKP